jgi:hypothetical protein
MPISWKFGQGFMGSGGKTYIAPLKTKWTTPSGQILTSGEIISTYEGGGKTLSSFPITNQPYAVQVEVTPTGSSQPVLVPIGPGTTPPSPGTTTTSTTTTSSSSGGAPGTTTPPGTETGGYGGYPSGMPELPSTGKLPSWVEPVAIIAGLAALGLGIYAVSRKGKSKRRR